VPPALSNGAPPPDYDDGRLQIRAADRVVLTDGRHLQLGPSQLGLLVELLRHQGRPRSREQLLAAVWGPSAEAGPRAVDVAIARLRAQLRRRIPGVGYIHTDFRNGYRFAREPVD
jgi:two-component system, OmpR family, catabolic regulation response regulator CreB